MPNRFYIKKRMKGNMFGLDLIREVFSVCVSLCFLCIILFTASCENDIKKVNALTTQLKFPNQSASNIEILYSDNSKIKLKLRAPELERYSTAEKPYAEFPKGLKVQFYDSIMNPTSSITCKYAKYFEKEKLWEAKNDVVAINADGDVLNTELLYWDEQKEKIYSDKFVRITTKDEVIFGEGFDSNQDFSKYTIRNIKGTVSLNDE